MSVRYTVIRTASPSVAPAAWQTAARFSRHRPACSAGAAADEVAGARVERDLPRAEQQSAGPDRVDIWTDCRRGVRGVDRLTVC